MRRFCRRPAPDFIVSATGYIPVHVRRYTQLYTWAAVYAFLNLINQPMFDLKNGLILGKPIEIGSHAQLIAVVVATVPEITDASCSPLHSVGPLRLCCQSDFLLCGDGVNAMNLRHNPIAAHVNVSIAVRRRINRFTERAKSGVRYFGRMRRRYHINRVKAGTGAIDRRRGEGRTVYGWP